jgi:hypothetical protein
MKKLIALLSALVEASSALAQSPTLDAFNRDRLRLNQRGLTVLGTWAAGNLLANGLLLNGATGRDRAFYQMNLAWGAVNLTLAGAGIWAGRRQKSEGLSAYESLKKQHAVEQVFLVNTALDVAYVAGGVYLTERGNSRPDPALGERLRGQGQAIVLQGAFLFLFDGVMYAVHRRHVNRNRSFWQRLDVADSGVGVRLNL